MPNIDERIAALTTNGELLSAEVRALAQKVDSLTNIVNWHETQQQRFGRALRAAFREYFSEDEGENGAS